MADSETDYSALYDGSGTTAGSLMPGGAEQKPRTPWKIVNIIILVLFWITHLGALITVPNVFVLIPVILFTNIALGIVSSQVRKKGKGKAFVYVLRVLAVSSMLLFYLPLCVVSKFEHTKQMYPLKRALGGHTDTLPEELPAQCEGYFFKTEGGTIAQDAHRSSYLAFYTDTETLDSYAAAFGGKRTETPRLENMTPGEQEAASYWQYPNCPRELPDWVIRRVEPTEDLHGAVIFEHGSSSTWFSGAGMLLDYDSGYVLFWT